MDGSVVFARLRQCALPRNTCFLGPTGVQNPNGISIGSAVFVELTTVTATDRPTDYATRSVTIGRIPIRIRSTAMRPNNVAFLSSCKVGTPEAKRLTAVVTVDCCKQRDDTPPCPMCLFCQMSLTSFYTVRSLNSVT